MENLLNSHTRRDFLKKSAAASTALAALARRGSCTRASMKHSRSA